MDFFREILTSFIDLFSSHLIMSQRCLESDHRHDQPMLSTVMDLKQQLHVPKPHHQPFLCPDPFIFSDYTNHVILGKG